MSRSLSVSLSAYLAGPMLALCNCILIRRLDGVQLGFTSLDTDLVVNGVTYEAFSSADLSDVVQQEGSGVDNLNLIGLLTSNRITDVDIEAGLWDGAAITLFEAPFEQLSLGTITLLTGFLGNISSDGGSYTAEVRSLSQRLAQQIVELTSNLCRAPVFGGPRCMPKGYNENGIVDGTITMANTFQFIASVFSVTSPLVLTFGATTIPAGGELKASGFYAQGRVKFNMGPNNTIEREVKSHSIISARAQLTLQEPFPFVVTPGDTALIEGGCNRTLSFCRVTVKNTYNHQAEAFLPGNDAVIARGKR